MNIEGLVATAVPWLASKAGEAVVEIFKEKFKEKILGRWTEYRAKKFWISSWTKCKSNMTFAPSQQI